MREPRCEHCEIPLIYIFEIESGVCGDCADALIERSRQRREWAEYHDEPCPQEELPTAPGDRKS